MLISICFTFIDFSHWVCNVLQEVFSLFGFPFLIRIEDGEQFSSLRERIRKKLDVPEKDYEKVCVMI